jgi:hypothetical protein
MKTNRRASTVETLIQPIGAYKQVMYLKGIADPAWLSGSWEIRRGNEVWFRRMAWHPMYLNDGHHTPVRLQEWSSAVVEIIDANHMKNNGVMVTRLSR